MRQIIINSFDSTEIVNVDTGCFSRSRNGELFVNESKTWTCLGAYVYNNFGRVTNYITRQDLFDILKNDKSKLYYKNGKAKFRLIDLDHGTKRVWSKDLKHYEIYSITKE